MYTFSISLQPTQAEEGMGHFFMFSMVVTDLCIPGWIATPQKVEELSSNLSQVEVGRDTTIVFEVFGNSTYRF